MSTTSSLIDLNHPDVGGIAETLDHTEIGGLRE